MSLSGYITRILGRSGHYAGDSALVIEHRYAGDGQYTVLQIRRVIPTGSPEQLQIEIGIYKPTEKRTTQMHHSFVVTAEIADKIAEACATVRNAPQKA